MRRVAMTVAAVLLCILAACTDRQEPVPGTVGELLTQKMDSEGLRPGVIERAEPFLLEGERYILPFSGGDLDLFAYADSDEAAQGLQLLDYVAVDWADTPHFFMRDHVIILYVGDDGEVLDLMERLCGPQLLGG